MQIDTFVCGMCDKFKGTRKGLREHLKEEHKITKEITNMKFAETKESNKKQNWWRKA